MRPLDELDEASPVYFFLENTSNKIKGKIAEYNNNLILFHDFDNTGKQKAISLKWDGDEEDELIEAEALFYEPSMRNYYAEAGRIGSLFSERLEILRNCSNVQFLFEMISFTGLSYFEDFDTIPYPDCLDDFELESYANKILEADY